MVRRLVLPLSALALLVAACTDSTAPTTGTAAPTASTTSLPQPASSTTTLPASASTPSTVSTTPTVTPPALAGAPGEPGVGDPYFPGLGNGGYDVDHYTLNLQVDPASNFVESTVFIEATATANLSSFNLDFSGLEVLFVVVDDQGAEFSRAGTELTIIPPAVIGAGETFVTDVTYLGTPEPLEVPGFGLDVGWLHSNDMTFVASEPLGAQTWFPVNDHPTDKATYTFRITVPEGMTAAANGVLAEEIITPGAGISTFVWEMQQPMASYLATVVAGDLVRVDSPVPGRVPIRDYFPSDLDVEAPAAFARTAEMIEMVESIVGPYPFSEYGVVVVDDLGGALETQSLSVFGRQVLTLDADFVERIVMHEIAHQWFGNSVSPATWRDTWLNEGFATFFELLWLERTRGTAAYDAEVNELHIVVQGEGFVPPGDPGVEEIFGGGVYQRGGLTLAALRTVVGDAAMFEILRSYYDRYSYGTATTADFIMTAEDVTGLDLGGFFAAWLQDPEVPPLP